MKNGIIKYSFLFTVLLTGVSPAFTQDTIKLKGNYFGNNIFVINPSVGKDTVFCVQKVTVNDQKTKDEIRSSSFEIDFSLLGIETGAEVNILIYHSKNCTPKILNPEVLKQQSSFMFLSGKVDKTGKLTWAVKGDLFGPFVVEQFRWKKWVTVGEVDIADSVKNNMYALNIKAHFGPNQFRISHTDDKGNTVYSRPVKYRVQTMKEIFITSLKVSGEIVFTAETDYELFDEKGNFISDGSGTKAGIAELPKGKYWVNYDNKTEMVYKK